MKYNEMVEVELKFSISDITLFQQRLAMLEARRHEVSQQRDLYFNHKLQDFAKEDLALRLRESSCESSEGSNDTYVLTFKGPNRDQQAKIRDEIEVVLDGGLAAENMKTILSGCGFYEVAEVVKRRESFEFELNGQIVVVCVDRVQELGTFVELEIVVDAPPNSQQAAVDLAKEELFKLAERLGLSNSFTTSYLSLLAQKRRGAN